LAIGIILLFVGVTIAPTINFNTVKASTDDDLVEVTTQACGIQGYGNTTVKLTKEQYHLVNTNSTSDYLDSLFFNITEIQNDTDWQTAWGLTSSDFNNDGKMDFAASYADLPFLFARISIFYNNGNNTYTRDQVFQFQYSYISSLISGDFTNDGYIDLIFSYSNWVEYQGLFVKINGTINILVNDGTNHFKPKREIARLTGPDIPYDPLNRINPKLTCADYDQDGDLDFIVGDNRGTVELYLNNGTGNFTSAGFIAEYKDLEGDRG
jgi:hypothetical protein